jgi:hypothetical protein
MAIDHGVINAGNVINDNPGNSIRENLQDWLDAPQRIKILPNGAYVIDAPLELRQNNVKIIGAGRGASVIRPKSEGDPTPPSLDYLLRIRDTVGDEIITGITIQGVGFVGRETNTSPIKANAGVRVVKANFCYFDDVAISQINGTGLELSGVQDSEFRGLDVRHCGIYDSDVASAKPGILVQHLFQGQTHVMDSNSLLFSGGIYERNRYPFRLLRPYGVRIIGMKMHGMLSGDGTLDPADLLWIQGVIRFSVIGCQFAHARRYSVYVDDSPAAFPSAGIVEGCTFAEADNVATNGESWYVVLENSRCRISDNYFLGNAEADSYTLRGGDIWLKSTVLDVGGENMHHGSPSMRVKTDYSGVFRHTALGGFEFRAPAAVPVLAFGAGGASAFDAAIERKATDILGPATGDSWQIHGVWNGGKLRLGGRWLWVDGSGRLRIRDTQPGSDTDPTVVGDQTE